ncbi:hypothetical protein [Thermodesulfatator autotrophicus]|nr:hypothetical protein [Thermodesulfatator autotrophicus]
MPTVSLIGFGALKEIPSRITSLGAKKPLIVTDQGIVATGILVVFQ